MIVTSETPLGVGCALGRREQCTGTAFDPDTGRYHECAGCADNADATVVVTVEELTRLHAGLNAALADAAHWRGVATAYQLVAQRE